MNKAVYTKIESYMLECMKDGAHDTEHIYRVLSNGLDISEYYIVDIDVVIASALLHDIGREEQFKNPKADHAIIGAEKAYNFILDLGWDTCKAEHIKKCISTHRFRKNNEPESIEAKIIFDSDKLDAAGAIGIARTLAYIGIVGDPLYSLDENGKISDGTKEENPSFFREYNYKLKNIYSGFYTDRAREIAKDREKTARFFYEKMLEEVTRSYKNRHELLNKVLIE